MGNKDKLDRLGQYAFTRFYMMIDQELLDQSWCRGMRMSTYGAAAKLVMRILTCLFIYLTCTQEVK